MVRYLFYFSVAATVCACQKAGHQSTEASPNIIVMLADDMGYSDLSLFGGEVPTPHIDRLGEEGATFTQFYNGARCCPARASLLTGVFAHQAGVGYMHQRWNEDGYQGHLDDDVVTLGEVMRYNGYRTFHAGKWHVGNVKNRQTPTNRGFDRSWWRKNKVNYFDTSPGMILLDGNPWTTDDPDYYLTDYTAQYAMQFMEEAVMKGQPFFGYVAWDACHWPLHAKEAHIARYRERYSQGWDQVRQTRISKQRSLGLIDEDWDIPERDEAAPAWQELTEAEQERWTEKMAVYAAQLHSLNENIGRVMDKLEKLGVADNTVVMILFDNGACAEAIGWNDEARPGTPQSYASYNLPWANASNAPFRSYKHFLYEGGISTPFLMWGKGVPKAKVELMGHIIDILPTVIDLSAGEYPDTEGLIDYEGQSLLPLLSGKEPAREWMFWEHEGNRAVRYGDWKLVSRFQHDTVYYERWRFPASPRVQEWELYHMGEDRTEQNELADQNPELVNKMVARWHKWADRVGVLHGLPSYALRPEKP